MSMRDCAGLLWVTLVCAMALTGHLALDSNTIRGSREVEDRSPAERTETTSNPHRQPMCSGPKCNASPRCSNRAQRRPSSSDRLTDRQRDRQTDTDGFNRTKGVEMSTCVRSQDCVSGLCCVRYLTGRRCQRVPGEGEACLLRGPLKLRRNLGRCDCGSGLACTAAPPHPKGQGVCRPRVPRGPRKTRHSGKKRRTEAEPSC